MYIYLLCMNVPQTVKNKHNTSRHYQESSQDHQFQVLTSQVSLSTLPRAKYSCLSVFDYVLFINDTTSWWWLWWWENSSSLVHPTRRQCDIM